MATKKNKEDRFEQIGSKIDPAMAEVLNACCDALEVDIYHLIQWFCYVIVKASAPMHALDPRIQKLMTMLESDAGWQNAFNLANPDDLNVAQVVLILEQKNHRGFGAVLIDKPFMGKAPEKVDDIDPHRNAPQMTENVDYILERVTEVTMHGIYRRLRLVGGMMKCNNLSDVLLDLIERQSKELREEDDRIQMQGDAQFSESGRRIEYGKRTKAKHHRTPDGEAMRQQRIVFGDDDREVADYEAKDWEGEHRQTEEPPANMSNPDDMEAKMGFKPHGVEW